MPPSTTNPDDVADLVVATYPDGELWCVWCGTGWGDVASLDDAEATRYSLDRAGGPWCKHHFQRHRFSRSRQLTGQLAVLAMTLPVDTLVTVVDQDEGVWGVTSPSVPGVFGTGKSRQAAEREFVEGLGEYVADLDNPEQKLTTTHAMPQGIGGGNSGRSDLSERVDEFLADGFGQPK